MAGHGEGAYWGLVRDINQGGVPGVTAVPIQNFRDEDGNLGLTPAENAAAAQAHYSQLFNNGHGRSPGSGAAISAVSQRSVRKELDDPIELVELTAALQKTKSGKPTSNQVPVELLAACADNAVTLGLLHRLVADIFEDGRPDPAPPPEPPPDLPPPEPPPNSAAAVLLSKDLVAGAKKHGWRCQWQRKNPKRHGSASEARYSAYCSAVMHAEAIALGAWPGDLAYDLEKGYLQIFPDSLRVDSSVATTDPLTPVTALLQEFARMRLKMLPKKGDLRDLNNWRGIMLLDAASKILSMIINSRLQRLLKEIGIEEQNGFSSGRGCAEVQMGASAFAKR